MEEQIEQAVACALSSTADPSLKAQAIKYCQDLKESQGGWQPCLSLFIHIPKSTPEARMFALDVVEHALKNSYEDVDKQQVMLIRSTLMDYVKREYSGEVGNNRESVEPSFLKNKFAHTITLLFVKSYPSMWNDFFDEFLSLLAPNGLSTNKRITDLFLRILRSIDEEVASLVVPRGNVEAARNVMIKDTMRTGDVQKLTTALYELLKEFHLRDEEIVNTCLSVIGLYIAWIDISLVVNDAYIPLLYQFLGEEAFRNAACECLTEIVNKGMKPLEKLSLIQYLNLTDVLGKLDLVSDIHFTEYVAKLTNVLGMELCKIFEETEGIADATTASYSQIETLIPFLLKFLGDEYDDTSSAVFGFLGSLQGILKKKKKKTGELTSSQRELLHSLLNIIVLKMKYDEDTDWGGTDEDGEDEAEFVCMRKSLKVYFDAILVLDEDLFTSYIRSAVITTLDNYRKNGNEIDWRELELALHVLYLFGERGSVPFIVKQGNEIVGLTPLGEMMLKMIESNVSTYPHPSIPLYFFEIVTRYYQFFDYRTDCIPSVLEAFVDTRGLHHSSRQIRSRSWYLFLRFVKALKTHMNGFVDTVLASIQDLLIVQTELLPNEGATDDILSKDKAMTGTFNDQIYLFEAAGILITAESVSPESQLSYAEVVINPLLSDIQQNLTDLSSHKDNLSTLQIHHSIMAIGSFVRGFPDSLKGLSHTTQWKVFLNRVTEVILVVLKELSGYQIIRDAVRFTFARLVKALGTDVLPYLPTLINALLRDSQISELIDVLPFIGLIAHKFKPTIFNTINDLTLPLVQKVFTCFNQAPSGTDETRLLIDLRKAYLNFVLALFNSRMEAVFVSELNQPILETFLQFIIHCASDTSDIPTVKTSFNVLARAINSWASNEEATERTPESVEPDRPLPGFEKFMYEHILRVCFEMPLKPEFNLNDAQSVMVLSEITNIQRAMLAKRPTEFPKYLTSIWFPSMQCPPELAEEYIKALREPNARVFRKYFQAFIHRSKS